MSRWFRFYDDAINDPKVQRLEPKLFKAWVNLLCLASKNDGFLPHLEDVSFSLRASENEAGKIVDALIACELIDEFDGRYAPHNWKARQFKSDVSNERVKQFRKRQRNVTSTVTETPPDTEADTYTEAEKKETREAALVEDDWPTDFRFQFWSKYPHKVGKSAVLPLLDRIRRRGTSWVLLMAGLDRYILEKPPDRSWCNPQTWLNQGRWEDQPATTSSSHGKPSDGHRTNSPAGRATARETDLVAAMGRGALGQLEKGAPAGRDGQVPGSPGSAGGDGPERSTESRDRRPFVVVGRTV